MVVSIIFAIFSISLAQSATSATVYAYGDSDPNNAKVFVSMPDNGSCNKKVWTFDITAEAQIAQWVNWNITGTKWTWFVRKPGEYFADCISFSISSNGDVAITFSDFGSPTYVSTQSSSVNPYIDVWYTFGPDTNIDAIFNGPWYSPSELNASTAIIPDSTSLHIGWSTKLWSRIKVVNCNSASTYRDTGTITLTLKNQKPWLDDNGRYKPDLEQYVTDDR